MLPMLVYKWPMVVLKPFWLCYMRRQTVGIILCKLFKSLSFGLRSETVSIDGLPDKRLQFPITSESTAALQIRCVTLIFRKWGWNRRIIIEHLLCIPYCNKTLFLLIICTLIWQLNTSDKKILTPSVIPNSNYSYAIETVSRQYLPDLYFLYSVF